jgi:hypothetical protein
MFMGKRLGCGFANTRNFPQSGFGAHCVLLSHGRMEGGLRTAENTNELICGTANGIRPQCQEKHAQNPCEVDTTVGTMIGR